jgi:hypothetical protein
MKYVFVYIYVLFFKIIDAFKPFIKNSFLKKKSSEIIKTLSGFIPCINNQFSEIPISVIETEKENCDLQTENCKNKMIIVGYMNHDPKKEADKNL